MQYKINKENLVDLITDSLRLRALDMSGVDNWTWYGENFKDFLDIIIKEYNIILSNDEIEDFSFKEAAREIILREYEEIETEEYCSLCQRPIDECICNKMGWR